MTETQFERCARLIDAGGGLPAPGDSFTHHKGRHYRVKALSVDAEGAELGLPDEQVILVTYEPFYASPGGPGHYLATRTLANFRGAVVRDGAARPRFSPLYPAG